MKLIVGCLIVFAASANIQAQGWRGIVPLHSSCDDVKQKLRIAECRNRTYDTPDSKVSILFSDGTCSSGWNVPTGTVITLDVHPKAAQRFSDLALDSSNYRAIREGHLQGVVRHENNDQSISITVSHDGMVMGYFYGPSSKDESLQCSSERAPATGSFKFDEYGNISRQAEQKRLTRFAYQLRTTSKSFLGYIFVYAGRDASPNEAHKRGKRAKAYLVSRGVEPSRLILVDGGVRETLTVELFVTIKDTIPPTPRPTLSPQLKR
jgi:hypothetical protein